MGTLFVAVTSLVSMGSECEVRSRPRLSNILRMHLHALQFEEAHLLEDNLRRCSMPLGVFECTKRAIQSFIKANMNDGLLHRVSVAKQTVPLFCTITSNVNFCLVDNNR